MPTTRRSRTLTQPPERVWELVSDPHHMPRWWPGVSRMEGVEDDRFTQVHTTRKGRGIRVDFHVLDSTPPESERPGRRSWEQEVIGTPFERVLNEAITEVTVAEADGGTRIEIAQIQRLRGYSRFGAFMLRRATRTRIDEALDSLARIA
jgi:uncharacterized protein YndB with AHSA1/START domain